MIIFSDPHLGLNRKAHTTKASRVQLSEAIHNRAVSIVWMWEDEGETVVCAGDLFDTFSNPEDEILKAAEVARKCDVILAGNHDSLNKIDAKGSLHMIHELIDREKTVIVANPSFDEPHCLIGDVEGMQIACIPHHATQELFEQAIVMVVKAASAYLLRAVFLHCNYNNPLTEGSQTALNLTEENAKSLLSVSDYVFLGHEHAPRTLMDGRLVILGNIHPTSFGDISDKFYWRLTPDSLDSLICWREDIGFCELDITEEVPPPPREGSVQFVDIVGSITAEKGADLAQYINDIWHHTKPLMVRNSVSIVADNNVSAEVVDVADLPAQIAKQLKGTNLEETYNHYRGKAKC